MSYIACTNILSVRSSKVKHTTPIISSWFGRVEKYLLKFKVSFSDTVKPS